MKKYVCECGRVFTEPNKFNGHKSNCRIHHEAKGTLEQYKQKRVQASLAAKVSGIKSKERAKERKQQELDRWFSEQHTCEKCGKVMTEKFGSGRFCSRSCANSRIPTEESNKKRSETLNKRYNKIKVIKYCCVCGAELPAIKKGCVCSIECYEKHLIQLAEQKVKQQKMEQEEKLLAIKVYLDSLEEDSLSTEELLALLDDDGKLYGRYINKIYNAKKEGIECKLTLHQYCSLVKIAGIKSSDLGFSKDSSGKKYVLARYEDQGDYVWGNCRFITQKENESEKKRTVEEMTKGMISAYKKLEEKKNQKLKST